MQKVVLSFQQLANWGSGDSPAGLPEVRQQYGLGAPRLSLMRKRTLHHSEV